MVLGWRKAALLLALLGLLVLGSPLAGAFGDKQVPLAEDFAADARALRDAPRVLLVLVSQSHCGFCEQLKEEVLEPMRISGDYDQRLMMRELLIDGFDELPDFDGQVREASAIASRYGVFVTPTVLLLGADGELLADKLVGVNTIEMYGYYLDEAIDAAVLKLSLDSER